MCQSQMVRKRRYNIVIIFTDNIAVPASDSEGSNVKVAKTSTKARSDNSDTRINEDPKTPVQTNSKGSCAASKEDGE